MAYYKKVRRVRRCVKCRRKFASFYTSRNHEKANAGHLVVFKKEKIDLVESIVYSGLTRRQKREIKERKYGKKIYY